MSAPTNIRLQRLQLRVDDLTSRLDAMTSIADGFNLQLRRLHAVLGHEKYNEILAPINDQLKLKVKS